MALSKIHRLTDKARISYALRVGRRIFVSGVRISVVKTKDANFRIAVVVPKTVDKRAVVRNKIRRRIFEAAKTRFIRIPPSCDVVITAGKEVTNWDFSDFKKNLDLLFERLSRFS